MLIWVLSFCMGGPCWHLMVWRSKPCVYVYVCVCVCVCVWVMLLLPFPNVTEGPTPEERAHNVGPHIVCVCVFACVLIISTIKPFKRIISTDVCVCVCGMGKKVCAHVCVYPSPLHPILYSLIASLIIIVHSTVQFTNKVFKTTSAYHKISKWIFIYFSQVFYS